MSAITEFVASGDPAEFAAGVPVVVLLHGYGSNERDLPGLAQHVPSARQWVSPRAPLALDFGGYAWAPLAEPGNPDRVEVEAATDELWAWIEETVPASSPIVSIGFSQGGLMASQLLRTRPDRIARTAILSGFILGDVQAADEQLTRERPPVLYCHGLDDRVIAPSAVSRTEEWLPTHSAATLRTYPGLGHSIDQRVLADLNDFLADN